MRAASPVLRMYRLALRRRLALAFGRTFDPYPPPPPDARLSPSERNRAAIAVAPMRLAWAKSDLSAADWQERARDKLRALLAWSRPESPPSITWHGTARHGELPRARYFLRAFPGCDIPVDIIRPTGPARRHPVMICLQGTNSGAHLSWGEARLPPDPVKIAGGLDIARQARENGFVAICIEQSCFGERREQALQRRSADPCIDAFNHGLLVGHTLLGDRASDVSAVIDWLIEADHGLPIDTERIFVMGTSSGGTTALFALAVDPRLAGAILCGCLGPVATTIAARAAGAGQAIVPGLLCWLDLGDVLALAAPRPVVALSGLTDHIYPFSATKQVVDEAMSVYDALAAGDRLRVLAGPGGHRFYPALAWPAFLELSRT